jgi:hypothetical protein
MSKNNVGMNLTKVHYKNIWKCHSQIPVHANNNVLKNNITKKKKLSILPESQDFNFVIEGLLWYLHPKTTS